jgi:hypothetical protein
MATIPSVLPVFLGGPSRFTIGDTAGNIINDAAVELGLSAVVDPYLSTDPNFIQLRGLLKSAGRDLQRMRDWTHLQKEYTFTTVAAQSNYDLPPDFRKMVAQSGWDRTGRTPLGGPLSPQEWQYLKGRLDGVSFRVLFRPVQQQLYLYPDTTIAGGDVIAFEYLSRYWVQAFGASAASAEAPVASLDVVLFEAQLAMRALKLAFLRAKGFDSQAAEQDFNQTYAMVASDDAAGAVLSLNNSTIGEPMLGSQSVPITGFGS